MTGDRSASDHVRLHRGSAEQVVASAVQKLRSQGERVTPARREVLDVLACHYEHLSADRVVAALDGRDGARIHRTTVYRTLETFSVLGIVTHRQTPGGATEYHLETDSHLHGHCLRCGEVVAIPTTAFDDAARVVLQSTGFVLDAKRSTLSGLCSACRG